MSEFPIMAYLGVHNNPNLQQNFEDFRDCGFNISLWRYNDHKQLEEACAMADQADVQLIACSDHMYEQPANAAQSMKTLKGLYGYYMVDEPDIPKILEMKRRYVDPIRSVDTKHPIYANLLPHYDDGILERLGVKTYREYLDASLDLQCDHISFDFYPVTKDGLRRDAWYNNLQEIADFAKDNGKDFWAFILSVPHIVYPQPELSHLRIQAYTNLAYGAQGLEYFTYQTPVNDPDYDFHNGPIDVDYKTKTNTWYLVKQMNEELEKVLPLFHHATDFKVVRTKQVLWWSNLKCKDLPEDVTYLSVNRKTGCIVSTFQNYGREYLVVVNSDYENEVRLSFYASHYVHINKETLAREDAGVFYSLGPGDIQIFMHED